MDFTHIACQGHQGLLNYESNKIQLLVNEMSQENMSPKCSVSFKSCQHSRGEVIKSVIRWGKNSQSCEIVQIGLQICFLQKTEKFGKVAVLLQAREEIIHRMVFCMGG